MVKDKWEKRLGEAVKTCEAITDNLKAQGYSVDLTITITDKKTKKMREIVV